MIGVFLDTVSISTAAKVNMSANGGNSQCLVVTNGGFTARLLAFAIRSKYS